MKTRKRAAEQQQICRFREKCKVVSGDNQLQFCDNHYNFHIDFLRNNPSILKKHQQLGLLGTETPDLKLKKRKVKNPSSIPPDEERCCRIGGGRWRCRNFRMKTKNYCEQHCRSISQHSKDLCMKKKKTGAGSSKRVTATRDSNRSKRPAKRQPTDKPSISNNPTTSSDTVTGDGSVKIGAKRKRVERMSGEIKSLTGFRGPMVETRASKRRKMVMECGETSNEPAANDNFESDGIVEGGPPEIGTKGFGEPVNDQLESVELYKSNCFELSTEPEKVTAEKNDVELPKNEIELEKNKVELEKNKVNLEKMKTQLDKKKLECTEFQHKLAELEETKKSTSTDENTTEFWRMEGSNAEILDQRMEDENSTIGCVETGISNLVSLVPGNGKESSLLRCQELSYSEKVESEAIGEGSKDSRVDELKNEEKVLNVEEGRGCSEERPSQHGSSSQPDLEMCSKTSFNLVSDSNGGDDRLGTEDSLRDSMDMIVPGNGNESLILRCQELGYSEKVESEEHGLQNEIIETGENQRDEDMSKPSAEAIGEGSKDSRAHEVKTEENALYVEEGKGLGCLEEKPSQHGSSSEADLETCKKVSLNLVSASNDCGDSLGTEDSLGDSMNMLAMKNLNMNKDKMPEDDMLFSVEDCMKAVGALYQQETSKD